MEVIQFNLKSICHCQEWLHSYVPTTDFDLKRKLMLDINVKSTCKNYIFLLEVSQAKF